MTLFGVPGYLGTRRGPLLIMCLPLVLALVMSVQGAHPQTMKQIPELPSLVFDQYLLDLGQVAQAEEVFGYFFFKNTSTQPLTITSLEPSCGCLLPRLNKKVYGPGESGEFLLRIRTALQRPGLKEFNVKVNYTDTKPQSRDVFLRVVFPTQQIYVKPMSLTFHQLGTSPVDQEFIVTDLRSNPAEIIGVESSSDFINVEVLKPTTTTTGAYQQRVRVTVPGAVPAGRQMATIKIYTNDEKMHEIKVPVQVFGLERRAPGQRVAGPQPAGPVRR
ncbi:MAG: DUF1573 domain-containing protein [Planctomycetota bacterium]